MKPRYAYKRDTNHPEIVAVLKAAGFCVVDCAHVGLGFPDLLVSSPSDLRLMEVKLPGEPLTPHEQSFHDRWGGKPILIVHSPEEALKALKNEDSPRPSRG